MSKINDEFARYLDSKGIAYKREVKLENYRYDFLVGKTFIEINPTYTHTSCKESIQNTFRNKKKKNPRGLNGIEQSYHRKKSICAINNGYKCIHKFDWMTNDEVVNLLYCGFDMIDVGTQTLYYNEKLNNLLSKFSMD